MADVAKCPFCLEWVRTAGILEPTRVQCPVCETQFSSSELLELQPPELLVLPFCRPLRRIGIRRRSVAEFLGRPDGIVVLPPD